MVRWRTARSRSLDQATKTTAATSAACAISAMIIGAAMARRACLRLKRIVSSNMGKVCDELLKIALKPWVNAP